jgi:pimeloyl-ACP methyl ester carboxylesterase
LSSLAEDVDVVMRAVNLQNGPVVLVGHCYGGTVITQAGCDSSVVALVYVAAFAPDAGESTIDSQKDYPPPPFIAHFRVDAGGFTYLSQDAFREYFAQDLPAAESSALAAAQVPIRVSALAEKVTAAAWRAKPSWYIVADEDRIIYPDLQRQFAQRMNATVITLRSSHVPFLSKPRETTAVIIAATEAVGRN